jgi:hypothetical protein
MLSAGFKVSEAFKKHTMHPVKRRHLYIGPTVSYDLRAAIATAKYLFNNVCTDHDLSGAHSHKKYPLFADAGINQQRWLYREL